MLSNRRGRVGRSSFQTQPQTRLSHTFQLLCAEHANFELVGFLRSPFPQSLAPETENIGWHVAATQITCRSSSFLLALAAPGLQEASSFLVASPLSTRLWEAKSANSWRYIIHVHVHKCMIGHYYSHVYHQLKLHALHNKVFELTDCVKVWPSITSVGT